jgi:serine protease AprX
MLTVYTPKWRPVLASLLLALAWAAPASAGGGQGQQDEQENVSKEVQDQAKTRGKAKLDLIVRYRRNPDDADRALVASLGGQIRRRHKSRWMSMRLPGHKVALLAADPNVEFVATDAALTASMDVSRATAGLPSPVVPESALTGAGVTVAMIDSGVALHPDIQTLAASVDFVGAYDPTFAPAGSVDPNGHGTHVAGLIVGNGSHSDQAQFAGIAPQASLVSLRVLNDQGGGRSSDMLAALQWVLDHKTQYGIRVLNLSLGHPIYEAPEVDPLVQAVDSVWNAGIVVVCAAGNLGRDGHGTISSPCNSRNVITVGALNDRRTLDLTDDTVTTYSGRGPARVSLVAKPDILAPGNRIVSLRSAGSYLDLLLPANQVAGNSSQPGVLEYFELSGTSMAAPMVSGAAALMLQQDPSLNAATVKARLMLSARKAAVGDPFAAGAGALDILAALHATGQVVSAPSPLTSADCVTGLMSFENTGVLWSNPSFSLTALWGSSVLWSPDTPLDAAVLKSSGVVVSDVSATALLWPSTVLSPTATLWPDSTLWAEAVLWPDQATVTLDLNGTAVVDP